MFLQETKFDVSYVQSLMCSTNPTNVVGVDASGSSNCGLVVSCWSPFDVVAISSSDHYVFCKISTNNGKTWYVLFFYGNCVINFTLASTPTTPFPIFKLSKNW